MHQNVKVKYTGTALPTDSDTFVLFSTVDSEWQEEGMAMFGMARLTIDIKHSHDLTLNWYKSDDRGDNWHQIDSSGTITAPAGETSIIDIYVAPYRDFKLELVNGGTTQTTFEIDMVLEPDRSVAV